MRDDTNKNNNSNVFLCSEMKTQQTLHVATPVRQSLALTKAAGTSVYLKLDSSQPTGSFKIRGIGHLCKTVSVDQFKRVSSELNCPDDLLTRLHPVCFPCSGQSEDVSALSAAQVSTDSQK